MVSADNVQESQPHRHHSSPESGLGPQEFGLYCLTCAIFAQQDEDIVGRLDACRLSRSLSLPLFISHVMKRARIAGGFGRSSSSESTPPTSHKTVRRMTTRTFDLPLFLITYTFVAHCVGAYSAKRERSLYSLSLSLSLSPQTLFLFGTYQTVTRRTRAAGGFSR